MDVAKAVEGLLSRSRKEREGREDRGSQLLEAALIVTVATELTEMSEKNQSWLSLILKNFSQVLPPFQGPIHLVTLKGEIRYVVNIYNSRLKIRFRVGLPQVQDQPRWAT